MIKKININTNNKKYLIEIESNSVKKNISKIIRKNKKIIFLIDKKVFYKFNNFKGVNKKNCILLNCSEKLKSFENYRLTIEKILKIGIDRNTTLVAIGGGTLGDLAGFISSTILRGVDLILIPTTLLSQVDSSIGGKNGINTNSGKNLVGTFYQPKLVLIDPDFLFTLPKRELLSGYSEIIKHGIINDKKFFDWLEKNSNKILKLNKNVISEAIYRSIKIKKKFVIKDEKEKLNNHHSRAILNYGHTFGHALEAYYKYNNKLKHGEAISIGMMIAAKISYKLKFLTFENYEKIKKHFLSINLPIFDENMYDKKIFNIILKDKKNINGKLNLILLKNIGKAFLNNKLSLKNIKKIVK